MTSVLWGVTPVLDKLGMEKASAGAVMAVRFTTTFVCILPLLLMPGLRSEIFQLEARTLAYIVGAAILSAIFGLYLYFAAIKRMEATQVVPICATYPLITFLMGVLFLQEHLTWTKAAGTVLAVAGVILISL